MSWLFTNRFRVCFILFAKNSQILLKISDIPILLTFMYLVALNLLVNNQLNSSLRQIIVTNEIKARPLIAINPWTVIIMKNGMDISQPHY